QAGPNSQGTWTWTGTAADEDVPVQTVTIIANDHHNPAVTTTFTVEFYAVKPTATITPAASTASLLAAASRPKEGQLLSFTGSAHSQSAADNSGPWTYSWSVTKDGAPYPGSGSSTAFSFPPGDERHPLLHHPRRVHGDARGRAGRRPGRRDGDHDGPGAERLGRAGSDRRLREEQPTGAQRRPEEQPDRQAQRGRGGGWARRQQHGDQPAERVPERARRRREERQGLERGSRQPEGR